MKQITMIVLGALVFSGCAHNVNIQYPAPGDGATGAIVVKLSEPVQQVSVTVDGRLLVEDEFTARVEVKEIPVGERQIRVVASGESRESPIDHTQMINIEPGKTATVAIATPARSTGYWIYIGLVFGIALPIVLLL